MDIYIFLLYVQLSYFIPIHTVLDCALCDLGLRFHVTIQSKHSVW